MKAFRAPQKSTDTAKVGDQWVLRAQSKARVWLVEVNADHWKGWLHARLATGSASAGSLTLFDSPRRMEHMALAHHFTAEKGERIYKPGVGYVDRWRPVGRTNHWLDAGALSCCAASMCGVEILSRTETVRAQDAARPVDKPPLPARMRRRRSALRRSHKIRTRY